MLKNVPTTQNFNDGKVSLEDIQKIAKALLKKLDDSEFIDSLHLLGMDNASINRMKKQEELLVGELNKCSNLELNLIRVELDLRLVQL